MFSRLDVVRPTQRGLDRINQARALRRESSLTWDDVEARLATAVGRGEEPFARDLPEAVDNSQLKYFPPIRSQGVIGSCAAFSVTYYIMTYMTALGRDWDVTDSGDANKFSPKFTYNLNNRGGNNPAPIEWVLQTQLANGCPTWDVWPYLGSGDTAQVREWPATAAVWRNAAGYRMQEVGVAPPAQVKDLLNNGYLISTQDTIYQWQYLTVEDNPGSVADDGAVGQKTVRDRNAPEDAANPYFHSSHALAVVGYNDAVWANLNGDDVVDPGELGAYKVANSWGTGWGNAGFMWIPYSVFNTYDGLYWTTARADYVPSLFAEVTLGNEVRRELRMRLGATGTTATELTERTTGVIDCADVFNSFQGAIPFNGTVVFDLTALRPAADSETRFIIEIEDTEPFAPTALDAFRIVDAAAGDRAMASLNAPFAFDDAKLSFYVDTALTPTHKMLRVPVRGVVYYGGAVHPVTWETVDGAGTVRLSLHKGGAYVRDIAASTANSGTYVWTVPADLATGSDYTVRIGDPLRRSNGDESDAFTIDNDLHDFAWSAVPDWVEQGKPFAAALTARNAAGTTLPNYAGTVALAGITGDTRDVGDSASPWVIPEHQPLADRLPWEYPVGLTYKVARTQSILTANALGGAPATITALGLNLTRLPGSGFGKFTVRLRHTQLDSYTADSGFTGPDGWTTVYDPAQGLLFPVPGQRTITFTTPFAYDGQRNLMVDISCSSGNAYPSNPGKVTATDCASVRSLYAFDEYVRYGNPTAWTDLAFVEQQAPFLPFVRAALTVPNYRLHMNSQSVPVHPTSVSFAGGQWSGAVAVLKTGNLVALKADSGTGAVGRSSRFGVVAQTGPALVLSLSSARIAESGGVTTGTVSLPAGATGSVLVYLSTDDSAVATITPTTVQLTGRASSAAFTVSAVNNGTQVSPDPVVAIRAGAAGYASAAQSLTVVDDETPTYLLRVFHGSNLTDGDGANYYRAGSQVQIQAFGPDPGKVFDRWVDYTTYQEYETDRVQFADATAPKTTVTVGKSIYTFNAVEAT